MMNVQKILCSGVCILLVGVLLGINASVSFGEQCEGDNELLTELGRRYEKILLINDKKMSILDHTDTTNPARYLRVLIKLVKPHETDKSGWRLVIRDSDYRPLQILGPKDFMSVSGTFLGKIWSRRLQKGENQNIEQLYFEIVKIHPDIRASFKVLGYIAMPQETEHDSTYYSVQDPNNITWYSLFEEDDIGKRLLGDTVGFLMGSRGVKSWCCSGVVIAVDESTDEPEVFFLTNFHCGGLRELDDANHWTQEICDDTLIDLSWDEDGQSREYSCQEVVLTKSKLDIAVLRLKAMDIDSAPIPAIILKTPLKARIAAGEQIININIIHHPVCEPKRISTNCHVIQASIPGWQDDPDLDFTYKCDTQNGSSGAPVFDEKGRLIGLHHLGFEKKPDGKCDMLNKAVRMDKILEVLKSNPKIKNRLREQ